MRRWWLPVLLGLLGFGVAGGAFVEILWNPVAVAEPSVRPQVDVEARAARRADRREARRAKRADRVRPDPKLPDAERTVLRQTTRDDQLEGLLSRIEAHADTAGWPEDDLIDVENILTTSTELISSQLADVDSGKSKWEEIRPLVRTERLASAQGVRTLLGETRFLEMAKAVGLERFLGEDPVRGRLSGEAEPPAPG